MIGGFAAVRDGPLRLYRLLTDIRQRSTRVVDSVTKRRLLVFAALCLVIVASRVSRLGTLEMDRDEVWSVWQTFGTPAQIISWTPSDWPPLYYLLMGVWRVLAGFDPFTVRVLSLLLFLPGMAILYRIGSKLFTETAALIAVAACAAMGFVIHISVTVRAYSLIFTLVMLAWWLALLYFEKPSTRRGIALGACIVALFYTHFTTAFAVIVIGLSVCALYPRQIWRWWLPLAVAMIGALPAIVVKLSVATVRASTEMHILQDWLASGATIFRQNVSIVLENLVGYSFSLWAVLVFLAGILIISRYGFRRNVLALLVWMLTPVIFFFAVAFDAFTDRHFVWMAAGYALWIGWGVSQMPRAATIAFLIVFVVVMSGPVPITETYKTIDTPLVEGFAFLDQYLEAGDVILVDPDVPVAAEEWDYFTRAYFPHGLEWVQTPEGNRHIWYFSVDNQENSTIYAQLQQDWVAGVSFHFGEYTLRLYEQPPDLNGILFENGMRFNGVEVVDQPGPVPVFREGETVHLRLWWSIDRAVTLDYSVGTYVFDQKGVIAQVDGPPQVQDSPHETSRWISRRYYVEDREITLPSSMISGSYSVRLSVYQWWDNKRMNAPGVDADLLLPILTFQVRAW